MGELDRLSPTRRPKRNPVGYQNWHSLAFLHWRISPDRLATMLPSDLVVDTCDGSAWVGLAPFHMTGVRPWWFPAVPGVSAFHETNVRTYVHRDGVPGVWFFSLAAASRLAVWIARARWRLAYHHSRMRVERMEDERGERVVYSSRRGGRKTEPPVIAGPGLPGVGLDLEIELDDAPELAWLDEAGHAIPGTLEHFLVERYVLFTHDPSGRSSKLFSGQVHHVPYPVRPARVLMFQDSLVQAAGIEISGPPDHVAFCEGVEVEIFGLEPLAT